MLKNDDIQEELKKQKRTEKTNQIKSKESKNKCNNVKFKDQEEAQEKIMQKFRREII